MKYGIKSVNAARKFFAKAVVIVNTARPVNTAHLKRTTNAAKPREAQIHAKVDGKKVIISEASIRRDLRFVDEEGVDCFSNEVIFEQLTLMGAAATTTTAATTSTISIDEITLAKALIKIKTSRPKANGIVMQELSKTPTPTPIVSSQQPSKRLQAKFDKEERLAREKNEANNDVIEQWHDVQANIEADYEMTQRLQAEEQEQLIDAEKEKLFMEFLEKRRKFLAAKRAEEKRNRPPTKAQQRSLMKIAQESSSKRARDELEQEYVKKQGIENKNESAELKRCLEIVPYDRDDVTIDATPLSSKSPTIVDYKIYKEGRKSF
nr:hypothetical protein [Tanacetum cinerariifolium]